MNLNIGDTIKFIAISPDDGSERIVDATIIDKYEAQLIHHCEFEISVQYIDNGDTVIEHWIPNNSDKIIQDYTTKNSDDN